MIGVTHSIIQRIATKVSVVLADIADIETEREIGLFKELSFIAQEPIDRCSHVLNFGSETATGERLGCLIPHIIVYADGKWTQFDDFVIGGFEALSKDQGHRGKKHESCRYATADGRRMVDS